jgi:hypothetical protein
LQFFAVLDHHQQNLLPSTNLALVSLAARCCDLISSTVTWFVGYQANTQTVIGIGRILSKTFSNQPGWDVLVVCHQPITLALNASQRKEYLWSATSSAIRPNWKPESNTIIIPR